MPICTFQYKEATITVREELGRDALDSPWILHDLVVQVAADEGVEAKDLSNLVWARVDWFVSALLRSTVDGDIGLEWPDLAKANGEEIYAAYQALLESKGNLVSLWRQTMRRSNLEVLDPED